MKNPLPVEEILSYWFMDTDDQAIIRKNSLPFHRWFHGGRRVDEEITEKFSGYLAWAIEEDYRTWTKTSRGTLALLLLFDQFSRNIYRDTRKAFSCDYLAQRLTLSMTAQGSDKGLRLAERLFVYMPLMHAEDRGLQSLSVSSFQQLVHDAGIKSPHNLVYYQGHLRHALAAQDTIERFGRFPHRNRILQRASTEEEIQFLQNPSPLQKISKAKHEKSETDRSYR